MGGITVYTVILDGYDNLRPPGVIDLDVRYVCITDEPLSCPPWEIQPAWKPYESNTRNSRIPKILSHLYFDSEYTIYHDGCLCLNQKPSELIPQLLGDANLAMYRHPCRKSIYEEIEICERENIGYGQEMIDQIWQYDKLGVKDNLWAGGFIARRNCAEVDKFNEIWWKEYAEGCTRDQIALPAAQLLSGIKIHTIDADILNAGPALLFKWHACWTNYGDNAQYELARIHRAARAQKLRLLCT